MAVVPFAEDMEKGLIVGLLTDPELVPRVSTVLNPQDFYRPSHQEIYKTILDIDLSNLDSLSVEERLTDPDLKNYFKGLVNDSDSLLPGLTNILFYAETIKDKAKLRTGIDMGREITAICSQDNVESAAAMERLEKLFSGFIQQRVKDSSKESTKESFQNFIDTLGIRIKDTGGIKTGFKAIDLILHKLEGLIVLAARPSLGKTSLGVNIARNVGQKHNVIVFSLEQPKEQIFERMLASESDVPLEDIRTGVYIGNAHHVDAIAKAKESLSEVFDRVHVDDTSAISAAYIASVARQKAFEWGKVDLIVVDYLHIMKLNDRALVEALGDAVKDLRALGRELGCPVLLLAQLSRQDDKQVAGADGEKKVRRRPELTDLRSSGEIEQSADIVMFLHRESYFDPAGNVPSEDEVEVLIRKNRNGRTGVTTLNWYPAYVKYMDRDAYRREDDGIWRGSREPLTAQTAQRPTING